MYETLGLHGDSQLSVAPLAAVFGLDGPGGSRIVARPDRRKRASKEAGGVKKEPVEMGRLDTQPVLGGNQAETRSFC